MSYQEIPTEDHQLQNQLRTPQVAWGPKHTQNQNIKHMNQLTLNSYQRKFNDLT